MVGQLAGMLSPNRCAVVVLWPFALGAFGSDSGVDVGLGGWLWWWSVRVRWVWDWHRKWKRVSRCGWYLL